MRHALEDPTLRPTASSSGLR